ncbi:RsbT co-antagonist protein RsbRA [Edaphobacillus lindanitolerans]|uniref:RsbT co-antagonist protein RsbR n=1 Tax=Edaphobacillus lindanitolerans TaxID=550447 RepID=A0A1U7PSP2_9BACI|nr:RsbT co-antagonist protein RsbRA [Edaphobacillus lindanitolerans]SIT89639.1 rsbT co-antagonist protein RsbR [Edaphobacillus lindanitolerans]
MHRKVPKFVETHLDEIIERWKQLMKEDHGDRFFQIMPDEVVEKTSHEFAGLIVSNLTEDGQMYESKLHDFSERIVRLGWSITLVMKAIENFSDTVYEMLWEAEVINDSNVAEYFEVLNGWIRPLREEVVEAYSNTWERTVSLQKIALQELSASLIPVVDKVSVMPLVGTIDTERAKLIMENLLEGVVRHRSEVVLLDITGVPVVDTMVAHHIIQAADAVRLVGARCMLVGIRPEIAQTIVALGIDLNEFTTTSTLQRGMQEALALTNRQIVEVDE